MELSMKSTVRSSAPRIQIGAEGAISGAVFCPSGPKRCGLLPGSQYFKSEGARAEFLAVFFALGLPPKLCRW